MGAVAWYRNRHSGLEVAFVEEVDRAFAEIGEAPERWPLWRQDRPYRQRRLKRFPFVVLLSGHRRVRTGGGGSPHLEAPRLLAWSLSESAADLGHPPLEAIFGDFAEMFRNSKRSF